MWRIFYLVNDLIFEQMKLKVFLLLSMIGSSVMAQDKLIRPSDNNRI